MRRPEGHDWIGIGLLLAGLVLIGFVIRLIATGDASDGWVFGPILALVSAAEGIVAYELWGELRDPSAVSDAS